MRKIENINDLKLEEYRLKLKAEKLSASIHSNWDRMKQDINPGKLAANMLLNIAENKMETSSGWKRVITDVIRAIFIR